ncbi:pyrroloquinoline quinone biosynthesis protein PqqB [Phytohabitans sp. ZYX-F-186]|uniref:Coenzyme PQQ synthesis protein B n=1 Tax=Phytohabitans maris TaxID=3071409 RepID=A0ABU0ZEP1_9ACTN|nr:pyrroloquinoline quinone biosynthesis protein PqqB [Phytohabitans sp. ZYX-F-186]MDQ7904817.1 pyrroloquinoline quinone biosynthesis protein PqqB [Phytohabitans sp. ZYX-F-186]
MKVRLLGTAAGGGVPQWNCACDGCAAARRAGVARSQDCVAISGDQRSWYLLNASPDLRAQILSAPELAPGPGRRDTPIRGVLLSTAELDHALGLLTLREAEALSVYASATVLAALDGPLGLRRALAAYTDVSWQALAPGEDIHLNGGLRVCATVVGAKRPRYAADADGGDWVVAYRITDPRTGGVLVYAPCLPAFDPSLVEGADCALLDGTFLDEDEMVRATGGGRSATAMGHLPVSVSRRTLTRPGVRRLLYTHLNNTNPLAVGGGEDVAEDGLTLTL